MRPVSETVDTLSRAAESLRSTARIRRAVAGVPLPWEIPLADLLDRAARAAQTSFDAVQAPSRGVDEPPGVAYGDPAKAEQITAAHHADALRVARALLGEVDQPETVQIKGDLL